MSSGQKDTQPWGVFGKLSLAWVQAFHPDIDYFVLHTFLEQGKYIVVFKDLFDILQDFMNKSDLETILNNLEKAFILKIYAGPESEREAKPYQQNRKIEKISLNENIHQNLTQMYQKIKDRQQKKDQEIKNQLGKKQCSKCGQQYGVKEIFLGNIISCTRPQCQGSEFVSIQQQLGDQNNKNLFILDQIIQKMHFYLEKCENIDFPEEGNFQRKEMEIEVSKQENFESHPNFKEIKEILERKSKEIFANTIHKKIQKFIQRKKKLLIEKPKQKQ